MTLTDYLFYIIIISTAAILIIFCSCPLDMTLLILTVLGAVLMAAILHHAASRTDKSGKAKD